jgi:uncharacterized protein YchJ
VSDTSFNDVAYEERRLARSRHGAYRGRGKEHQATVNTPNLQAKLSHSKVRGGTAGQRARRVVIKANYAHGNDASKRAKGSAAYYMTREDDEGNKQQRTAFSADNDTLSKKEVYQQLSETDKNCYYYRMVFAPETDSGAEGVDLQAWTREVMGNFEARLGYKIDWVAVEHSGATSHTEHAHVHVIAPLQERLDRDDFRDLRFDAQVLFNDSLEQHKALEKGLKQESDKDIDKGFQL